MSNKNLFYLCLSGFFLSFQVRNNHCAGSITSDVYSGTSHIKDTVNTGNKCDTIYRKSYRIRTIASMTIPAPGTPAVPMEASVAVSTIVSI